ncbi:MAG: ATP-binding protein [Lachnospiraceae bacterium]|nr:ATP-binding protein [Lachnospiraceae bacterium]
MPLTNAQYDAIMRRYDEIRERHRHELLEREAEIEKAIPLIRVLNDEAGTLSLSAAKRRIADPSADISDYSSRMKFISEKRKAALRAQGYPEDYLDMQYDCPLCRDSGYADGVKCVCMKKAAADLLYRDYRLGDILQSENFDCFSFDCYSDKLIDKVTGRSAKETARIAFEAARLFTNRIGEPDNNLLIYGNAGVGKTFLTHCIAKEVLDKSCSALYFSAKELFDLLADTAFGRNGKNSTHTQAIYECDLLTIDDLGTESANSFTVSQLFYVLNERMLKKRSTIISTNLMLGEFAEMYTERIFSRITSHYTIIKLIGEDIRMQKKANGGRT